MNFVRHHVQCALLYRYIPAVDPSACGKIDLDVLSIDNGWLIAIAVKSDCDLCWIKKGSDEQEKQATHGEILTYDPKITGGLHLVVAEFGNGSALGARF